MRRGRASLAGSTCSVMIIVFGSMLPIVLELNSSKYVAGGFGEQTCHLCHLTFVQHNQTGSRAATQGTNTWTMAWTAPSAAAGPVQFNVAANASNNDDSPLGDYIYVTMARSTPAR